MERKINPLINSHTVYKTMNLINPYIFNSDFRTGLIFDMPIHEGGGSTTTDKINSLIGTIVSGVTWTGNKATFATNGLITVAHNSVLNLSGTHSFSFWIKFTTTSNLIVFEKNGGSGYSIQTFTGGKLIIVPTSGSFSTINKVINDGAYHHVVITVNGTTASGIVAYVDGVLYSNSNPTASAPSYGTNTPVYIGSRNGAIGFNGGLGDLRFYNAILSQSNVTQLYSFQKQQYM
jgi:hypothetical protein